MRIHFEGSQVGELQDLLSKQDSFQVKITFIWIETITIFKVRRRKKLLVLVNPVGGRGKAVQIWKQVLTSEVNYFAEMMWSLQTLSYTLIKGGRCFGRSRSCLWGCYNHPCWARQVFVWTHFLNLGVSFPSKRLNAHIVCREIVSSCKIGNYGGVVTVSGQKDGSHYVIVPITVKIAWRCANTKPNHTNIYWNIHKCDKILKHTTSATIFQAMEDCMKCSMASVVDQIGKTFARIFLLGWYDDILQKISYPSYNKII